MDGLFTKIKSTHVKSVVEPTESFIALANILNWQYMADLVLPDLKKTKRGFWWVGRILMLRVHLGVMILQMLLKETDRGIEKRIMHTPLFQVFCGYGIIKQWKCPDHTRIEDFRNRLSSEVHRRICCHVVQIAAELGLADPSWMDVDSTVQEANMSYPSDASLMRKLAQKCVKVWEFLKKKGKKYLAKNFHIDVMEINKKAKEYFFLAKNASIKKRREVFEDFYKLVKSELQPMIGLCENMTGRTLRNLPWNIRYAINQVSKYGWQYLLDVAYFIRTHKIKCGKILSFHCFAASCIKKGKVGKENEFGRVFQIGRIGGNFLIPFMSTSIKMPDKKSLIPAVMGHQEIFGVGVLKNVATDKGYFSKKNILKLQALGINADGIARPGNIKIQISEEQARPLKNRRAGIEPLTRHAKKFGLGKSKMKSDQATLAAGYRSILGFNLSQLKRYLEKDLKKVA